jgi:hypothetical protein
MTLLVNSWTVGSHSLETSSHPIDMNNNNLGFITQKGASSWQAERLLASTEVLCSASCC